MKKVFKNIQILCLFPLTERSTCYHRHDETTTMVSTIVRYMNRCRLNKKYNTVGTIPKYTTVGTIPKFNIKIVERRIIDTHNT
jgi:hypothetical protein